MEFVLAKDEVFSQNQEIQNKYRQSAELPKVNDFKNCLSFSSNFIRTF